MKFFAVLALCVVGAIAAPLSADQAATVQSTWASVRFNEVDILAAVFAAYPDIQARFPQFAGKDLASLKDSAAFATHAGRIVGFISELIALVGNESNAPAVNTLISQLAASHKGRGIAPAQFNEFRTALVAYLQANVAWNAAVESAWTAGLDNIFGLLFAQL
ncbi:globin CTT-VIIA-like [Chironomus tepperi]|uniref:globin CTT-VIIA-like n=1 Tax=Chironomus tepperi TaxID=113505 RepID=UPI00391F3DBE